MANELDIYRRFMGISNTETNFILDQNNAHLAHLYSSSKDANEILLDLKQDIKLKLQTLRRVRTPCSASILLKNIWSWTCPHGLTNNRCKASFFNHKLILAYKSNGELNLISNHFCVDPIYLHLYILDRPEIFINFNSYAGFDEFELWFDIHKKFNTLISELNKKMDNKLKNYYLPG